MSAWGNQSTQRLGANEWFATTHWSVVLAAKQEETSGSMEALGILCTTYWRPIYAFLRRDGYNEADAQDLTQDFFAHLIAQNFLGHHQDKRGKFRSFLLTFLRHFLSDHRDRQRAQKRGGGQTLISLDQFEMEERLAIEPADPVSAEQEFDRRWAQVLIETAYQRLQDECEADGAAELYMALNNAQAGDRLEESYAELGRRLGMSESAVKSAIHRLRRRHRVILRAVIAATVGSTADVNEEIRYLIAASAR
jgi:RNA polymerase sigma factor (sigma-70 family)